MKIYIKNMACDSCKTVVKTELKKLRVPYTKVVLGEADIKGSMSEDKKKKFNSAIKKSGLELLESKRGILIEKIKLLIHDIVANSGKAPRVKFSVYLSEKLSYDYNYLSNLFSETEVITIEQYMISVKIERIKELILFDDITLTEIAHRLHYSSVAHLSAQFKKATGLNPSHFKKLKKMRTQRKNAD
ncbi:MAG: AraC family transcriptional regulator [Bacteroidota bacterium]